jgi:ribosomal protein S27AE
MTKRDKMICPDCGVEMNHHADKIDYTAALEDPKAADPDFGGVIEEAHTCPNCGRTQIRFVPSGKAETEW